MTILALNQLSGQTSIASGHNGPSGSNSSVFSAGSSSDSADAYRLVSCSKVWVYYRFRMPTSTSQRKGGENPNQESKRKTSTTEVVIGFASFKLEQAQGVYESLLQVSNWVSSCKTSSPFAVWSNILIRL